MAGTFSVLAVLPLVFLAEIGFVFAFDIGDPIWKPSRPADGVGAGRSLGHEGRAAPAESA